MDEKSLKSIPLFASLSKSERQRVAACTDEVDLTEGKVLVEQGKFAYEFFVIEEGTAEVLRNGEHVADLQPGDFLGEVGAVSKAPRNATVVAQSPMRVVVMTARDLRRIDADMPTVAQQIRHAVSSRAQILVG